MTQLDQLSAPQTQVVRTASSETLLWGIPIAVSIFCLWAASLIWLLSLDIARIHTLWIPLAMLWQAFLYTGLFITAHDAMHGRVFPQNLKVNHFIGSLAVLVYGLFSYEKLLKKHWQHHHHPASELDPDFHDSKHKNFFAWYFHFMKGYWSWIRFAGLIAVFHVVHYTFQVPEKNLTLFWMLPAILSSAQLFYFGTFLPHREPQTGHTDSHRAQSTLLPAFWSFITCYHFGGYHWEHHEYPQVPWWRLPAVYKMSTGRAT